MQRDYLTESEVITAIRDAKKDGIRAFIIINGEIYDIKPDTRKEATPAA